MRCSDTYRDLLLETGHGLPLWIPDPNEDTNRGTSVGDLGLLTDDGGFDYLCNIRADASDPVNQLASTPSFFTPLPPNPTTDIRKTTLIHPKQACLTYGAAFKIEGTFGAEAQAMYAVNHSSSPPCLSSA